MKHVMPNSGGYDTAAQTEPKDRRKVSLLGSRAATWVIHGHFMSCLNTLFVTTAGTQHVQDLDEIEQPYIFIVVKPWFLMFLLFFSFFLHPF